MTAKHLWRPAAQPCRLVPLKLMGTNLSLTTPYWQCATGCYAGYHPTTGYSGQRTTINSLPTHSFKDASTPNWNQMVLPFIWPRSNSFKSRRRGRGYSGCLSRRTSLPKAERKKAPFKTPPGEPLGGLQKGLWTHPKYKAGIFPDAPCWLWPWGVPGPLPYLSGDGHHLMDSEIHEVVEVWTGWKDLWATHHTVKGSPKCIHCFWVVPPTKLPKIMGLKGIHSPEVLCQHVGLSFCPWCGKEGQNEGTVVNHLQTSHYHLGLVCSQCLKYNQCWQHWQQWWPREGIQLQQQWQGWLHI